MQARGVRDQRGPAGAAGQSRGRAGASTQRSAATPKQPAKPPLDDRLRHVSPLVWTLQAGTAPIRRIFPDVTDAAATVATVQRWRRKALNRLLQRRDSHKPPPPLSTDWRGLLRVYDMRCGTSRVSSALRPAAWRRAHAAACPDCAAAAACPSRKLFDAMEFGWLPALADSQPAWTPPRPRRTSRFQAQVQAAVEDLVSRQKAVWLDTPPRRAALAFMVLKRKFTEQAGDRHPFAWSDVATAPLYTPDSKPRVCFDYRTSGLNLASEPWPLRMATLHHVTEMCTPQFRVALCLDWRRGYQQFPLAEAAAARLAVAVPQANGSFRFAAPTAIPFGLNSAVGAFCTLSAMFQDIAAHRLHDAEVDCRLSTYIDDLFVAFRSMSDAERGLSIIEALAGELGVEFNFAKRIGPATHVAYLGTVIDLSRRVLRMPTAKVSELRQLAAQCLRLRHSCPSKLVRRTAGLINWFTLAMPNTRAFAVSITAAGRYRGPYIRLRPYAVDDLNFWLHDGARATWDGSLPFLPASVAFASFISDAGANAVAAHTANRVLWRRLSPDERQLSSTARELLGIELALASLAPEASGRVIVAGCDNTAAVIACNSGSAGRADCPTIPILRRIARLCHSNRVVLTGLWLDRRATHLADAAADCMSLAHARAVFDAALLRFRSVKEAAIRCTRPGQE